MAEDMTVVDLAIGGVIKAAQVLGLAKATELELVTKRQIIKPEAIARIMQSPDPLKDGKLYSATAAAEVVSLDPTYADCQRDERLAVKYTIEAMGLYEAAKLRGLFAVNMAQIEGLEPLRLVLDAAQTVVAV